jgi:hypothetical protein
MAALASARRILAARRYALHRRHRDDFPALFAFGDVVELELAAGAGPPGILQSIPAVVVDVLRDNWLRLLVPNHWVDSARHHIFHVRTWNVALRPEWAAAPRAELRSVVFGAFVLQLALLAAAVFDPADFEQEWHMLLKDDLSENLVFTGFWEKRFASGVESASLFVWDV